MGLDINYPNIGMITFIPDDILPSRIHVVKSEDTLKKMADPTSFSSVAYIL